MQETGHREVTGIVSVVARNEHRGVRIDAKEIGSIVNALDFFVCELRQPGSLETLLFAHGGDSIDHQLGVVTVLREDGMHEPTELYICIKY